MQSTPEPCACGSGWPYEACCGRWHAAFAASGQLTAPTPEALMRSRYSAFVLGRTDYLRATWHPDHCPADPSPMPGTRWLGLEVRSHRVLDDTHAEVEFVARYRVAGRGVRLHERSRFVKQQGRWLYVDGDLQ